jgi:2-methylcitrate dehydratase PrpD
VEGVLQLKARHAIDSAAVTGIEIETFHEATRLACRVPASTEEAQYSLPFPVAVALHYGRVDPEHLLSAALRHEPVLRLSRLIEIRESPALSSQFPARRLAHVAIHLQSGEVHRVLGAEPRWEGTTAPGDDELLDKFRRLSRPCLDRDRLLELLLAADQLPDVSPLVAQLARPL